jgi:transcriptional regulator with XRE-family HTH domain
VQRLRRAVGARIAGRRKAQEWSQGELVGRIGGRAGRLSMIENGHSEPSLSELLRLRQALGVSLDELVAGTPASGPEDGSSAAPADAGPSAALRSALQRIERACNARQLTILAAVMNGLASALQSGEGPDRPPGTDA